jgi:hypothetical protein
MTIVPHPAHLLVEKGSQAACAYVTNPPGEHQIELSKAISLKRIADVLQGDELNTGMGMMLGFLTQAVEMRNT